MPAAGAENKCTKRCQENAVSAPQAKKKNIGSKEREIEDEEREHEKERDAHVPRAGGVRF